MSTTVSEAVKGFTYTELRHYVITRLKISAPGKGMKQLISTISSQDNVGTIVKELQRYKKILEKLKNNKEGNNDDTSQLSKKRKQRE